MKLDGRTVVVSGGASGLGGATAEMIVAAGGHVVILDVNESSGRALVERLGPNAELVRTDVTSAADVQRAIDAGMRRFGAIHGAVCAAGIATAGRVLGREGVLALEDFARVIDINLIGTFNVVRLAAAAMASNAPTGGGERGAIVTTASVAAFDGQIGQAAYAASNG